MSATRTLRAIRVRVMPGVVIYRHGRAWNEGEVLDLLPDDAARLARHDWARDVEHAIRRL